jgi:hypothetical protein
VSVLVAVTDHAAERYRQRVGSRTGAVDVKLEVIARVSAAWEAGRVGETAPAGASGARGTLYLRGSRVGPDAGVVYVCRREGAELIVVTLWEDDGVSGGPRVPRRFTDALRDSDHTVAERSDRQREREQDLGGP